MWRNFSLCETCSNKALLEKLHNHSKSSLTLWFRGVLERLLRPLMRTLSLRNDTSQGDGGPPEISHSASSVVEASKVASSTIMPPSPTYNKNDKNISFEKILFYRYRDNNLKKKRDIAIFKLQSVLSVYVMI